MRLIDADAICKECIEEFILETCEGCVVKEHKLHKTIDAVPVVRCKDCKHWSMGYCNHFAYYSYEPMTNEDDFCSYGERREGE